MKRIVFFCDGTWNRADAARPTTILRLAQAVTPSAADGIKQLVFYKQGVGTGRGSSRVARWADRFWLVRWGGGCRRKIVKAYRNLVFCAEPGDQIFIFGFPCGAYMARSLAGSPLSADLVFGGAWRGRRQWSGSGAVGLSVRLDRRRGASVGAGIRPSSSASHHSTCRSCGRGACHGAKPWDRKHLRGISVRQKRSGKGG